jgi:nucleotide-binding universal stress UspA family protein
MIVLGSHGDTGYRRDRVGSVAAAVVNQAPCTVELIKVVKEKAAQAVKA